MWTVCLTVTSTHSHLPVVEEETADVCVLCDRLIHSCSMHSDLQSRVCLGESIKEVVSALEDQRTLQRASYYSFVERGKG